MSKRKRGSTTTKKRRKRRKTNVMLKPTVMRVKGVNQLFADQCQTELVYNGLVSLIGSTDVLTVNTFRGNSIVDPDFTSGTSHDAMPIDFWANFYEKAYVRSSRIEVDFLSLSSGAGGSCVVGVVPVLQSTDLSSLDINVYNESPYAKFEALSNASAGARVQLDHFMSTDKMWGRDTFDDVFIGSLAAVPSNVWYWQVYCGSIDQTTDPNVRASVRITYYVTLFKRKPFSQTQ